MSSRPLKKHLVDAMRGENRLESAAYTTVREHFEPIFNAAARRQGFFQQPASSTCALLCALLGLAFAMTVTGQALDDPTRPYRSASPGGPAGEAPRPFELSGVLLSPSRRVAVINGGSYREGDVVDGARVVRIEQRSVRLQKGDQSLVVELSGEPPKSLITRGEPIS